MENHLPNVFLGLWALVLFFSLLWLSRLVRPVTKSDLAPIPYDSGKYKQGEAWVPFSARYHLLLAIAVLFFSVLLFLFPAATVFQSWISQGNGMKALVIVVIFLTILIVALGYSWKRGDLDWSRSPDGNP